MKISNNIRVLMVLAACASLAVACKDKDKDGDSESFTGSVNVELPKYVEPGFSKQFQVDTMSTLAGEDGLILGYYFRNPFTGKTDTVRYEGGAESRVFTLTVKDTVGKFSLSVAGFARGYYSSSASASFVVIKKGLADNTSITGFDIRNDDETFIDSRDGRQYYTATVGGRTWMRQNLAWTGAGRGYEDYDVMSDIFGRYYTWEEAQTACPSGWRLPCEEDWTALASACGVEAKPGTDISGLAGCVMENLSFNGTRMWPLSREVKITNSARLSLIPAGMAAIEDGEYTYGNLSAATQRLAMIWGAAGDGESGECRYLYSDRDVVYYGMMPGRGVAASVRCIKEQDL